MLPNVPATHRMSRARQFVEIICWVCKWLISLEFGWMRSVEFIHLSFNASRAERFPTFHCIDVLLRQASKQLRVVASTAPSTGECDRNGLGRCVLESVAHFPTYAAKHHSAVLPGYVARLPRSFPACTALHAALLLICAIRNGARYRMVADSVL